MNEGTWIRRGTLDDLDVLARHRAGMFADMGMLPPGAVEPLVAGTREYLRAAMPAGSYVAWVAGLADDPTIVAGAGLVLRRVPPTPVPAPDGRTRVIDGREGLVLNVYVEPGCRRRGLARRLMDEVIAWSWANGLERLVLHASDDGRPLYERLGFRPTNEMRLPAPPPDEAPAPGR